MKQVELEGVFPPIPTPFDDGRVAYDKLASNVEKWSKTGINGFVVFGSNGESVFLSNEEKKKAVEVVLQTAPDNMSVVVGSGCESTLETIRLTEECAKLGAHAALIITPHFYIGGMNANALYNHYTAVADSSPIPVVIYNVPKFTNLNIDVDVVARLSGHPNIIGIKDSTGNVSQLGEFLNRVEKRFSVLVGTAGALLGGVSLGCPGGVLALANVAPENCLKIVKLVKDGKFEEAKEAQLKMIPVNNAVTSGYGIRGLKAAMDMLGYFGGAPRLPLLPATEEEKGEIRAILEGARLLR